jgi:hypothetical protein
MVCRNEQRGREAAAKVRESTGNNDVHLAVSEPATELGPNVACDQLVQVEVTVAVFVVAQSYHPLVVTLQLSRVLLVQAHTQQPQQAGCVFLQTPPASDMPVAERGRQLNASKQSRCHVVLAGAGAIRQAMHRGATSARCSLQQLISLLLSYTLPSLTLSPCHDTFCFVIVQVCDMSSLAAVWQPLLLSGWLRHKAWIPCIISLTLTHTLSTLSPCLCRSVPAVTFQVCDVSSLASVAAFAAEWLAASRPLHLLVNNAGVLVSDTPSPCSQPTGV